MLHTTGRNGSGGSSNLEAGGLQPSASFFEDGNIYGVAANKARVQNSQARFSVPDELRGSQSQGTRASRSEVKSSKCAPGGRQAEGTFHCVGHDENGQPIYKQEDGSQACVVM